MTARKKASVQGARRVIAGLDNFASLFQGNHAALGIPQKVAMDFAYRCDLLSDSIERGFNVKNAGYYNPAEIGEEVPGPLEMDSNNPFMKGEFTQERFNALAAKQMSGALAAGAAGHLADPKLAALVAKQAAKLAYSVYRASKKSEAEADGPEADGPEAEGPEAEGPEAEGDGEAAKKAAHFSRLASFWARKAGEETEETEETEEEPKEEAKKSASVFGLFSR